MSLWACCPALSQGLVATGLYRRYNDIRLPDYLGFFGGKRFVPIVTALAALALGAIFGFIWPPVEAGVDALGQGIVGLGAIGTGIYGFLNRLLITCWPTPRDEHLHLVPTRELQSTWRRRGGSWVRLPATSRETQTLAPFLAGFFPIMMFGLPAAALAMIRHARQTKVASGILPLGCLSFFPYWHNRAA